MSPYFVSAIIPVIDEIITKTVKQCNKIANRSTELSRYITFYGQQEQ
jgi:hypothetical protein